MPQNSTGTRFLLLFGSVFWSCWQAQFSCVLNSHNFLKCTKSGRKESWGKVMETCRDVLRKRVHKLTNSHKRIYRKRHYRKCIIALNWLQPKDSFWGCLGEKVVQNLSYFSHCLLNSRAERRAILRMISCKKKARKTEENMHLGHMQELVWLRGKTTSSSTPASSSLMQCLTLLHFQQLGICIIQSDIQIPIWNT